MQGRGGQFHCPKPFRSRSDSNECGPIQLAAGRGCDSSAYAKSRHRDQDWVRLGRSRPVGSCLLVCFCSLRARRDSAACGCPSGRRRCCSGSSREQPCWAGQYRDQWDLGGSWPGREEATLAPWPVTGPLTAAVRHSQRSLGGGARRAAQRAVSRARMSGSESSMGRAARRGKDPGAKRSAKADAASPVGPARSPWS